MDFEEIKTLIEKWETNTLECKETTGQLKEVGKTLCGFLNNQGGIVLIGIKEKNKQPLGQDVSDKTQQDIAHMLCEITPAAPIVWDIIDIPNSSKKIISLEVQKPVPPAVYHFNGKAYERVGSSTLSMKYERLKQLMSERAWNMTWDQLPTTEYTLDDLDQEEIQKTVEDGIACGRLSRFVIQKDNILSILMGLELVEEGKLTNAAIVLFAKKLSSRYSQCELKMARFIGNTKTKGFIDEKRYIGNAFNLLEEGEAFLRRHLNIRMEFSPNSFKRIDTPQLPFLAIREALVNAICHRLCKA